MARNTYLPLAMEGSIFGGTVVAVEVVTFATPCAPAPSQHHGVNVLANLAGRLTVPT
jgi:hypothetical protein